MKADNSPHLLRAARERTERTEAAARQALEQLASSSEPISVAGLAEAANVSRSWIYTRPELRQRIEELAAHRPRVRPSSTPADQRASTASLHRRLELSHQRVEQLSTENRKLRDELARAYGRLRLMSQNDP